MIEQIKKENVKGAERVLKPAISNAKMNNPERGGGGKFFYFERDLEDEKRFAT